MRFEISTDGLIAVLLVIGLILGATVAKGLEAVGITDPRVTLLPWLVGTFGLPLVGNALFERVASKWDEADLRSAQSGLSPKPSS